MWGCLYWTTYRCNPGLLREVHSGNSLISRSQSILCHRHRFQERRTRLSHVPAAMLQGIFEAITNIRFGIRRCLGRMEKVRLGPHPRSFHFHRAFLLLLLLLPRETAFRQRPHIRGIKSTPSLYSSVPTTSLTANQTTTKILMET